MHLCAQPRANTCHQEAGQLGIGGALQGSLRVLIELRAFIRGLVKENDKQIPGSFPGWGALQGLLGWMGPQTTPAPTPAVDKAVGRQRWGGGWRQHQNGSPCNGRFAPMSPFYLFITYKLGVRLTLLKANKAGQRMGPPDRAVGAKREEARRKREGCGFSVKGAGGGGWAGASRQDPVSGDPNTFMAIASLPKLRQLRPASRKFQTLKDTRELKR